MVHIFQNFFKSRIGIKENMKEENRKEGNSFTQ